MHTTMNLIFQFSMGYGICHGFFSIFHITKRHTKRHTNRHSMINHCDKNITLLSDTDTVF